MRLLVLDKVQSILNKNSKGYSVIVYHRNPHQYKVIIKEGFISDSLREILALDNAPHASLSHRGLELT